MVALAVGLAAAIAAAPAAAGAADAAEAPVAAPASSAAPASAPSAARDALVADIDSPDRNAVVSLAGCTAALIAPDVLLTAAHCAPIGLRVPMPRGLQRHDCPGLEQQAEAAQLGWEDAFRWYPLSGKLPVRVGARSREPRFTTHPTAYALPACADMALVRLAEPVPKDVATPLPVLSRAPLSGRLPSPVALRHASFAGSRAQKAPSPQRGTGLAQYWGANACVIVAIPPKRPDGRRLYSGDSGSPLLLEMDGEEVVAGTLFVIGLPDIEGCGTIRPAPLGQFGSWTPTWREAIPGTDATDIGEWLRRMVPEADHR